ncbi:MAG: CAP domain-containing protein, partial [Nocardioides sp.]
SIAGAESRHAGEPTGPPTSSNDSVRAPRLAASDPSVVVANLNRAEIEQGFYDVYVDSVTTPLGWTGSVATCDPGTIAPAAEQAALRIYNYLRDLPQLPAGRFDDSYSARAQAAALMMEAEGQTAHFPDRSWACFSAAGAQGAANSNLYLASDVPDDPEDPLSALGGYMVDDDESYGHRRWILNPVADRVGFGQTRLGNALYVLGESRYGVPVPLWLPWPAAGYFPNELEPAGDWTLSSADPDVNFSRVRVSITAPDGSLLPGTIKTTESGFGPETLAIEISRGTPGYRIDDDLPYRVVVSGIRRSGRIIAPVAYETTFVGYRPLRPVSTDLSIVGEQAQGGTLRLSSAPVFEAPVAGELDYQWYADGKAIEGATRTEYQVRAVDVDNGQPARDISVDVTARSRHHDLGTLHVGTPLTGELVPVGAPTLAGAPHPARMLAIADDDVTATMASYTYRWLRDGVPVAGAVGPSRAVTIDDLGHQLSVEATASLPGFADLTRTTAPVLITPDVFLAGPPPTVKGRARVGTTVRAKAGLTTPTPRRIVYQWLRNGSPIAGATQASYRVTSKDRARSLAVRVTVSHPGLRDKTRTSPSIRAS